jgi:hypothetical protein
MKTSRTRRFALGAIAIAMFIAASGCSKAQRAALVGAGIGAAAGYVIGHEADKAHHGHPPCPPYRYRRHPRG